MGVDWRFVVNPACLERLVELLDNDATPLDHRRRTRDFLVLARHVIVGGEDCHTTAGIARGILECVLGVVYLARGIVTFDQAGFGLILAALISIAYMLCYPTSATSRNTMTPRPQESL